MNGISGVLNEAGVERLGWALVHSLWEGALIAALYGLAQRLLCRASANVRYWVACAMLLTMVVGPLLTVCSGPFRWAEYSGWYDGGRGGSPVGPDVSGVAGEGGSSADYPGADWVMALGEFLQPCLPWFVVAWTLGVVIVSCRWVQGLWWLRRLRRVDVEPVEASWEAVLEYLKSRFDITRKVRIVKSTLAEVPMVVGWLKPIILLPASSLTGLTPDQLEAVLAHELAHIRRYDYVVNGFQNVIETLLFYHPAVWWISRCIRAEREHCCDDLVLRVCDDRLTYARALFRLEELRGMHARLAFSASGGPLLQRIRRLLGGTSESHPVTVREFAGLLLLAFGCVLVVVGALSLLEPKTYSATARIRLEHHVAVSPILAGQEVSGSYDPYFIQTEFEVLQSRTLLGEVVDRLDLTREWGKKQDQVLRRPDAIELLRGHLVLRPVRNTSLIEIRVNSDDASEAARIANTIVRTYQEDRTQKLQKNSGSNAEELLERLKQQDVLVTQAQSNVDSLRVQLGVNQTGQLGESEDRPPTLLSAETLRRIENLRLESQTEYMRTRALLATLKELPRDQLPQAVSTAGLDDQPLSVLLAQQSLVEQKLIGMQKEFGPQYTEVIKLSAQAEDLKKRIAERTAGILAGLEAKVAALRQGLSDLSNEVAKATETDIKKAQDSRPYFEAKRELEERVRFRQMLYNKLAAEKTDVMLIRDKLVEIVDEAVTPSRPVSPNWPQALGMLGCGALFCLLGLVLARSGRNATMVA